MTAPHVEFGNTASDLGQGATSFVKGLLEERRRKEQLALQAALVSAKLMEANQGRKPERVITQTDKGLEYGYINPDQPQSGAQMTGVRAPESQILLPTQEGSETGFATVPRYQTGQPAQTVQLPQGVTGRREAPTIMTTEGPQGPQVTQVDRRTGTARPVTGPGGSAMMQPKADDNDERRARDAFEMVQGISEMKRAVQTNPAAYQGAAAYISALDIADGIPLAGDAIQAIIRNAQGALDPQSAQYFNAFMQFAAARAFSRGGATLTKNEIDYALLALSPKPGEDPTTSQQRERLVNGVIAGAVAGNAAWQRYSGTAKQLGFDLDTAFGGVQIPGQVQQARPQSKYGYQRP